MSALHENASSNPLGINSNMDKIYFHPYFTIKDLYFFILFFILFSILIFFYPNFLGQNMAVCRRKSSYYYNAICLDNLYLYNTHIISLFLAYIVIIYRFFKGQSAGNPKGSSETTRVFPDKNKEFNY
jgi:quinol-cytochrome oxidoreductase complex cytochrome b subunit